MKKLTDHEARLLDLIGMAGGSWCPTQEERERPEVWAALRGLERKRRLWVEAEDGAMPRYHMTAGGF